MLGISIDPSGFILRARDGRLSCPHSVSSVAPSWYSARPGAKPQRPAGCVVSGAYVQLVQGIPLPVVMFLAYFGISIAG